MAYEQEYRQKKGTPAELVGRLPDGVKVFTTGEPVALFDELFAQRARYTALDIYSMMGLAHKSVQGTLLSPQSEGHFHVSCSYVHVGEAAAQKRGVQVGHMVTHFSRIEDMVQNHLRPAWALANVSPMDEEGYFSSGYCASAMRAAVDGGARVLAQVNRRVPTIYSNENRIHISEIDALCEVDTDLPEIPDMEPSALEKSMAGFIVERIPDGATIQLGVGGVPSAAGIFLESRKDLGLHTEVFTNAMKVLMEKGAINNSKKKLEPGKSVFGFVQGTRETFDFVDRNDKLASRRLSWVNDPMNIAQNDDMMSINSCLAVDLRGQVCSECLSHSIFAGSGGQLDFIRGVWRSKGGMSFIAMRSTVEKEGQDPISKICLSLPEGSVVTTPRNDVQFIVTEYGVAEMKGKTMDQKARELIRVAHPDFRDRLTHQAKQHNIIW